MKINWKNVIKAWGVVLFATVFWIAIVLVFHLPIIVGVLGGILTGHVAVTIGLALWPNFKS